MADTTISDLSQTAAVGTIDPDADFFEMDDTSAAITKKTTARAIVRSVITGMQSVFDLSREIVTTVAKGALIVSSLEDIQLVQLFNDVAGGAVQPLLEVASAATDRVGPLVKLALSSNIPGVQVDVDGHNASPFDAINVTSLADIVKAKSVTSAKILRLRRSLLKFSGDEDAAVTVDDVTSGSGRMLTLRGGNTTDAGGQGGGTRITGGDNGDSTQPGDVSIGDMQTGAIYIGVSGVGTEVQGGLIVDEDLGVTGSIAVGARRYHTGIALDTALTGTVNDFAPATSGNIDTSSVALLVPAGDAIITGLDENFGSDGRRLTLINASDTKAITLSHQDAGSAAQNRFALPGAANVLIPPGAGVELFYVNSRWGLAAGFAGATSIGRTVSGTTDTPGVADHGTQITFTNAGAITVTISGKPKGWRCEFYQDGAGQITLSGSGVTLRPGATYQAKTLEQYAVIGVYFIDTTHAVVYGAKALV